MTADDQGQTGQDLIWNYYQTESTDSFEGSQARIEFVVRRIPAGASVLNIGCGTGLFERLGLARGLDVHALDPSEQAIAQLRTALAIGDKAQVGHIQRLPFADGQFDVVVATEVLEHLPPEVTAAGLAEIRRVLKVGGRLLGTVPSRERLEDQIVVCPCCAARFHKWGHRQRFDPDAVRRLLSHGFTPMTVVARPFVPWSALTWKGQLVSAMKMLLWRLGSHGSNENIFFEAVRTGA
jgi:SAM-dependent methyltransferase